MSKREFKITIEYPKRMEYLIDDIKIGGAKER